MARVEFGRHKKVTAIADDPTYDVGADEWNNDAHEQLGVLGFDDPSETLLSGGVLTPTNSPTVIVVGAQSGTEDIFDNLTLTDYQTNDTLIFYATTGDVITVTHEAGGSGQFSFNNGVDQLLSDVKPLTMVVKGTQIVEWKGVGGLSTLPPPTRLDSIPLPDTTHVDMLSADGWVSTDNGASATTTEVTDDVVAGTSTVELSSPTTGAQATWKKTGLALDMTDQIFGAWFKVKTGTALADVNEMIIQCGLSGLSGFRNFRVEEGNILTYITDVDQWVFCVFAWGSGIDGGTGFDRTAIDTIRLKVTSKNTQVAVVKCGGIYLIPEPSKRKGVVSFTFDDGYDSVYDIAAPKLAEYGYRGTSYPSRASIGTGGFMTLDEIQEVAHEYKWEIGGHGGTNLTTITSTEINEELKASYVYLSEHGLMNGAVSFSYPNGGFNDNVIEIIKKYYAGARTIVEVKPETLNGWRDNYRLRIRNITVLDTPAAINTDVETALNNGEWLILAFHDIVTSGATGNQYNEADFNTVVDAVETDIASLGGTVLPVSEVISNTNELGNYFSSDFLDVILNGRLQAKKDADVASAGIITLGRDGNVFDITGTTTINEIVGTDWQAGSGITLHFDGALTLTHNSGGTNDLVLTGATNATTAAGDVYSFYFDGTDWIELSRNGGSGGGEVFTWTADHDTGGFALTFTNDTTSPAGGIAFINWDTSVMQFNVPTGDSLSWRVNDVEKMRLNVTALTLADGVDLIIDSNDDIQVGLSTNIIRGNTSGMTVQTGSGDSIFMNANGSAKMDITPDGVELQDNLMQNKGVDEASATILTLSGGNVFDITGTTTINEISGTGWVAGSTIILQFDGILTVTDNSGGTNDILLSGGTGGNMTTAAGDVLQLYFDGTDWHEVSRAV